MELLGRQRTITPSDISLNPTSRQRQPNNARRQATPQGSEAAPGLRVAQALPKPVVNVAAWGGSALAAAQKQQSAGIVIGHGHGWHLLPAHLRGTTRPCVAAESGERRVVTISPHPQQLGGG